MFGRLHRPEAAVAAAVVGRAECAAAGVRDRPEAGRAVGDHHADVAARLALEADAVRRDLRPAAVNERSDHLEQLALVDRAAVQFVVDLDVRRDRRRRRERRDVARSRVDGRDEVVDVGEILQRLDPAGGGAGADRDEPLREGAHLLDPLRVVRVRHRALDERKVVRPLDAGDAGLEEVGDVDLAGEREQLVLAVEQRELAAVAGGELPDGEGRLRVHSSRTASRGSSSAQRVDRPVAADQGRAELAVAAPAEPAAHVALHREVDPLRRDARLQQGLDREPHHDLRPDDERGGGRRVEARGRDQLRNDADLAAPFALGGVDGDVELQLAGPQRSSSSVKSRSPGVRLP